MSSATPIHIVLPCFNEQDSIQGMVSSLTEVFANRPEFLVSAVFVDDGSHDATWHQIELAHALELPIAVGGIRLEQNQGKAAAQAAGVRELGSSRGLVVIMDSDGQHDPSHLPDVLRACLASQLPQIARRTDYKRGRTSMLGTLGVSLVAGLTGARFDPTLGEYMVLPAKTVRSLARNPQFGVVPLVPLVQASVPVLETFSSPVLERSDGSHTTRWTRGQLWHKALLLLLANPWAMLPRVALAIALTVAVLGSYGMAVGIASVIHGTFLGVGSVLIAIVLVFSVLACLQLVTLGLVVVLFRSAPHGAPGASSDLEILDWSFDSER